MTVSRCANFEDTALKLLPQDINADLSKSRKSAVENYRGNFTFELIGWKF
jgi:hypothetical protein